MTAQENHYDGPSFLPGADRVRPPMQLEQLDDQPLNLHQFMNQDDEDADPDKRGGSQDGLLQ